MSESVEDTITERLAALGSDAGTLLQARETLQPDGPRSLDRARALVAAFGSDALLLEGTLGQGAMGVVHVATQASLGRKVAVKKLHADQQGDALATLKLLREAWVTGSLEHPNIVPIHDVRFDDAGEPQVVLKRIEGVAWTKVIKDEQAVRERFGAESLLEHNLTVLLQLCRAVHFAHSRGVLHRDLKPDNVMIGMHGEVYLLDWGIAVSLREDPEQRLPLAADNDEVAGTPGYMAPEMLLQLPIDERTDVYLLGATLYEVLSGEPPHYRKSVSDVVRSVLTSNPPRPAGAPKELFAIVRRAMAPTPEHRFESAEAFRAAVQRFLEHKSAIRLADEAERRLTALAAIAAAENARDRRIEAYELYGACCFGYREALATRPGYARARRGVARAVAAMVELELACGSAEAAGQLLAELVQPQKSLVRRVAKAARAERRARLRLAELVELGEDFDARRGMRARRLLVAALGFAWTLAPLVTAVTVDPRREEYPPMLAAPLVVMGGLGVLTFWRRAQLKRTAINRRVVAAIAVGLVGQLAVALLGPRLGTSPFQTRVVLLLVWALVTAMGAITIDRRLAWGALGFFAAFVGCAAFATTVAHVLYAMSASYFVVTMNVLAIWRPEPATPSRRSRPPPSGL